MKKKVGFIARHKNMLVDFPTTNYRGFWEVTISLVCLFILVIRVILSNVILKIGSLNLKFEPLSEGIILSVGGIIVAAGGWSYAQYYTKRKTYDPKLPTKENLRRFEGSIKTINRKGDGRVTKRNSRK